MLPRPPRPRRALPLLVLALLALLLAPAAVLADSGSGGGGGQCNGNGGGNGNTNDDCSNRTRASNYTQPVQLTAVPLTTDLAAVRDAVLPTVLKWAAQVGPPRARARGGGPRAPASLHAPARAPKGPLGCVAARPRAFDPPQSPS
jgi:hypothetical protein